MSTGAESKILIWLLCVAAGFCLICAILNSVTDSFEVITRTAAAGTMLSLVMCFLTHGLIKEGSWYSTKIHFLVICSVMAIVSLKTKFAL